MTRTGGADATFPRRLRILLGRDFERVMRSGRKAHTRNLIVFAAGRDTPDPRIGLAVGRKVGNAVCRNRWKRLIREAFRLKLKAMLQGVDVVVAVKAAQADAPRGSAAVAKRGSGPRKPRRALGLAGVQAELLEGLRRLGIGEGPGDAREPLK